MSKNQWSLQRPEILSNVYGYPLIKKSLNNFITTKKFPNAIIFQGESGIGKTTLAKILAKIIVCQNPKELGDPCCKCPECLAVENEDYNKKVFRVNGGTEGGVDSFKEGSELKGFTESVWMDKRVVLVEEFQGLSASAKETLYLALENPETDVHYIMTTTGVSGAKEKKNI